LLERTFIHQTLELSDFTYVLKSDSLSIAGPASELLENADFQRIFLAAI
jgi:ABC-type branched-subunit amino acid transport system ATPase component